jgi:hypothetical protein
VADCRIWGPGLALALALGLVTACATGGEGNDGGPGVSSFGPGPADDASGGDDTAATTDGGTDDPDPTFDDSTGGDPSTSDGMDSADSTAGSTGDAGGGPVMCTNALTCPTADQVGGVAGDAASPPIVEEGDEPTWVTVQVSEMNSDVVGEKLSVSVTLASPPGIDFDLFVQRGAEGGANACGGGPNDQSTNSGGTDTVSMDWGEGAFGNNSDDGAWIAIEVRPKDGMCQPGAQWTLTIQGDA